MEAASSSAQRTGERAPLGGLLPVVALLALAAGCETRAGERGVAGTSSGNRPVTAAAADSELSFGSVGPFALVSQTGERVTDADLAGRPWVLSCIYTTCHGPCPEVSASMADVQDRLADVDVRLVSISVDPARDTPEVLARYAQSLGADPERWLFLTGEESAVHALVRDGFHLAVQRAPGDKPILGQQVSHDRRLVAVDAQGRVRGYYGSEREEDLDRLEGRMRFLVAEAGASADAETGDGPDAPSRP